MSFYGSRALSRFGHTGGAFAGYEIFLGGPEFQGGDSFNVFFDDGTSRWAEGNKAYNLTYARPSVAIVNQAGKVWAAIEASGDPAALAYKAQMQAKMEALTRSIDQLAASRDIFGYSQQVSVSLVNRLKELKALVQQVAAYKAPVPAKLELPSAEEALARAAAAQGAGGKPSSAGVTQATQSGQQGVVADEPTPWLLYAGIGLGAVALLGGLAVLVRRPSGQMRGNRRRRRR